MVENTGSEPYSAPCYHGSTKSHGNMVQNTVRSRYRTSQHEPPASKLHLTISLVTWRRIRRFLSHRSEEQLTMVRRWRRDA